MATGDISNIRDVISKLDFNEYHQIFLNNSYYEILFPFLLIFAILYTILSHHKVRLFQNRKTGKAYKPIVMLVSIIVAFFSVYFEISAGQTVGGLMMMMFPNISALTIGILCLYIIGAIFGKDFFRDMFDKDHGAYIYFAMGGIGLGSVIFYVGISLGIWDFNPLDGGEYWTVIFGVLFFILTIVFFIIGQIPMGLVFLFVFLGIVFNSGDSSPLGYFIDPIIFIVILIIVILSWLNSDTDSESKKRKLMNSLRDAESSLSFDEKHYDKDGSRLTDITRANFEKNKSKWEKLYGGEDWRK